ncbi:MAG: hypothetical protein DMH00_02190 [Acidobacteria bacterium]|nr:MAG: hypothetical protein DMH00_02190 [Acidobacteriota bacterium]
MQGWLSPHRISPRQREELLTLLDSPEPSSAREKCSAMGLADDFPLHATLIGLLTHLDMTEEEAARHWRAIALHREELTWRIARDPGTRVAALDYFMNREKCLVRPKLVDEWALEQAERTAESDGLTGLANARSFGRAIRAEARRAVRRIQEFSVALLDLDDFSRVTRDHGRTWGDVLLREVAALVRARLRDIDLAARLGGAHFGLLLPMTRRSGAHVAAERIREGVAEAFLKVERAKAPVRLTLSAGLASFPGDSDAALGLLQCASDALAAARNQGGNRVVIHYRERRRDVRVRSLAAPLRLALVRGEELGERQVRIRDISRSGALLESPVPLPPGETVRVRLPGPGGAEGEELEACVIREEAPSPLDRGAFRAGIHFRSAAPIAEQALDKLLETLRRQGVE